MRTLERQKGSSRKSIATFSLAAALGMLGTPTKMKTPIEATGAEAKKAVVLCMPDEEGMQKCFTKMPSDSNNDDEELE